MLKKKNTIKEYLYSGLYTDDEKICLGCYRSAEEKEIRGWFIK